MTLSKILSKFAEELSRLADAFLQKPRDHAAVPVLADVAAFFSQLDAGIENASRSLARAVLEWAKAVSAQMVGAQRREQDSLRAKQCLYSAYSILCHSTMVLSVDDARRLCRALVLFRRGLVFGASDLDERLDDLRVRCEELVSRRIQDLLLMVSSDLSIFTSAIKEVLHHAPHCLHWVPISARGTPTCYAASCGQGHLYSINLLTGAVLLDGFPPGRLPDSMLQHPLYLRTFGKFSFEVNLNADGTFKTSSEIEGCFYEFTELNDGRLLICELRAGAGYTFTKLELVEPQSCGDELPVRLKELCSQWIDRADPALVVFRPINFLRRQVEWLLSVSDGECVRVPQHVRECGGSYRTLFFSEEIVNV
jgi:hypothetical protein